MNDHTIHDAFVKALLIKIPKKTLLADFVADTLCMEKETAYRRLRGEVQFSLREAGILASRLHISLDETLIQATGKMNNKLVMHLPDQSHLNKQPYLYMKEALDYLEEVSNDPFSEFGVALSGIPYSLYSSYPLLARFFLMKHIHHAGNRQQSIPFESIEDSEAEIDFRKHLKILIRRIKNTYYIWDRHIIRMLVSDIKYARSIRLLTDTEVSQLKDELILFLKNLERLAVKGKFDDTGNNFELYISDAHIDVTYAYLCTEDKYASMISSFVTSLLTSEEKACFKDISNWVKSLKRFSTLISGIGERERITFFEQQYLMVESL